MLTYILEYQSSVCVVSTQFVELNIRTAAIEYLVLVIITTTRDLYQGCGYMKAVSRFLYSADVSIPAISLSAISFWFLFVIPTVSAATASSGINRSPVTQQPQQQQFDPITIGVLDLDPNNVDPGETVAISERLRLYLGEQGVFRVIERQIMSEMMDEVGFQFSGACDTDECVVQVGRILGARKMVAGSVSKVGTIYSLQIRLVDIETSTIEFQALSDVNGVEEVLMIATRVVAVDLAQKVIAQTGITPLITGNPLVVTSGQIRIESNPAGAEIFVDGDQVGVSPRTLALEEGTHELVLALNGYLTYTDNLAVIGGESRTITIPLNAIPSGTLRITTDPTGVTVLINGEERGVTPAFNTVNLYQGEYTVEFRKEDFEADIRIVRIRGGISEQLSVEMVRSGQARLSLTSQLSGARVSISSMDEFSLRPVQEISLRPGRYTIEVKARGYSVWRQTVTLEDGDDQTIPVILRPKSRVGAGIISLIIPGGGQYYSRRSFMGTVMLLGSAAAGYMALTEFNNYNTITDEHTNLQQLYDQAVTSQDITTYRQQLLDKAVERSSARDKLVSAATILGGVWALNVLDAFVLMPRLRQAVPGTQSSVHAYSSGNKLFLALKIEF